MVPDEEAFLAAVLKGSRRAAYVGTVLMDDEKFLYPRRPEPTP